MSFYLEYICKQCSPRSAFANYEQSIIWWYFLYKIQNKPKLRRLSYFSTRSEGQTLFLYWGKRVVNPTNSNNIFTLGLKTCQDLQHFMNVVVLLLYMLFWTAVLLKFAIKHAGQISTVNRFVQLCWVEISIRENISFEIQTHYFDSTSIFDCNNDVEKQKFQLYDCLHSITKAVWRSRGLWEARERKLSDP